MSSVLRHAEWRLPVEDIECDEWDVPCSVRPARLQLGVSPARILFALELLLPGNPWLHPWLETVIMDEEDGVDRIGERRMESVEFEDELVVEAPIFDKIPRRIALPRLPMRARPVPSFNQGTARTCTCVRVRARAVRWRDETDLRSRATGARSGGTDTSVRFKNNKIKLDS